MGIGVTIVLIAVLHANSFQRGGLVEGAPEVADEGLAHLLLQFVYVFSHQAFYGGIQHGGVVVVDAHAGGGIGANGNAVGRINAIYLYVDGECAEVQKVGALEGGVDAAGSPVRTGGEGFVVFFAVAAGDAQELVGG